MKKINLFIGLMLILSISLISGNGIRIEPTSLNINKTQNTDYSFDFKVFSEEPFTFYNISFDNSIIEIDEFSLESGENKTIQAKITKDELFNEEVRLKGFYNANLGSLNETYDISVNYQDGISNCDLTIIKGDKVIFKNTDTSKDLTLRNSDTGNDIKTIQSGKNYTMDFDTARTLNYYFLYSGFAFSEVCQIVSLDSEGLINNPNYDAILNLKVNINFKPTNISTTFLSTDYTIKFSESKEDIFSIINTGNEPAKSIKISGDWFTFSDNLFDLEVGESKNIGYTISPYITSTEQTNKTYNKPIKIEGNFQTINKNLTITIPYKNLNVFSGNSTGIDENIARYFIRSYCNEHPNIEECERTIVNIINESSKSININTTQSDWNSFLAFVIDKFGDLENTLKNNTEELYNQGDNPNELNQTQLDLIFNKIEENKSLTIFAFSLIIFIVAGGIIAFLILNTLKNKDTELLKW